MKKSRVFGLLLAFLWLCMPIAETVSAVDLSLLGSAMAPQVSDPGFGWGELAAKLDNYSAAYSKAINPVTVGLADAPLNGNGDIGLVMGGDASQQTVYIGKNDFWNGKYDGSYSGEIAATGISPVTVGGMSWQTLDEFNLAVLHDSVSASSAFFVSDNEAVVSGKLERNPAGYGWVSEEGDTHWFQIGFAQPITFSRYVLMNDGATRLSGYATNTSDFQIQISDDGNVFTDVDSVSGNTQSVVDRSLSSPQTTKFVRINITKPTQTPADRRARITQFFLYGEPKESGNIAPEYSSVSASSNFFLSGITDPVSGTMMQSDEGYGWISEPGSSFGGSDEDKWYQVSFDREIELRRFVLKGDGAVRETGNTNNTRDFDVEVSLDGTTWQTAYSVRGNYYNVVDRNLEESCRAKHVRIHILDPGPDGRARITQLELYETTKASEADNVNLAPGYIRASVSSELAPHFDFHDAIDGAPRSEQNDNGYGWVSDVVGPYWMTLEFDEPTTIARYEIENDGAIREIGVPNNTRDFELQYSVDGSAWMTADSVVGNTANVVSRSLAQPVVARFVRLNITDPTQTQSDRRARIVSLKLFAKNEAETLPNEGDSIAFGQHLKTGRISSKAQSGGKELSSLVYALQDDNYVVVELTNGGAEALKLRLDVWSKTNGTWAGELNRSSATSEGIFATRLTPSDIDPDNPNSKLAWISEATIGARLENAVFLKAVTDGSARASGYFSIGAGATVRLICYVDGGIDAVNTQEACAGKLAADFNSVAAASATDAWWKEYWLKSYVDLGDELVEKSYYASMYALGCSSREGKTAPGLFGPFITTDTPSWQGGYTLDYNFFATFYGANAANRSEFTISAIDELLGMQEMARSYARNNFDDITRGQWIVDGVNKFPDGIDGLFYYPQMAPKGYLTFNISLDMMQCGLFAALPMIEYFAYTRDVDFLRDEAYPFYCALMEFWEDYLVFRDGQYYILNSAARELNYRDDVNPIQDISFLHSLLDAILEATQILNISQNEEPRIALWRDYDAKLCEPPTMRYNGKTVFAEAANNRSTIALYGPGDNPCCLMNVFPAKTVGLFSEPELVQIGKNTVMEVDAWDQYNAVPHIFTMAARVGVDPEIIFGKWVSRLEKDMFNSGLICPGGHGIDPVGSTQAIHEMLLHTSEGILSVFPNWRKGKDAKFYQLQAEGSFLVSAAYDGASDSISYLQIESRAGGTLTMVEPWSTGVTVKDSKGNPVALTRSTVPNRPNYRTISFDTVEGEVYSFEPVAGEVFTVSAELPEHGSIAIDLPHAKAAYGDTAVVRFFPEAGYRLAAAYANGQPLQVKSNRAEVCDIAGDTMITATFTMLESEKADYYNDFSRNSLDDFTLYSTDYDRSTTWQIGSEGAYAGMLYNTDADPQNFNWDKNSISLNKVYDHYLLELRMSPDWGQTWIQVGQRVQNAFFAEANSGISFYYHTDSGGGYYLYDNGQPVAENLCNNALVKGLSKRQDGFDIVKALVCGNHYLFFVNDELVVSYADETDYFPQGYLSLMGNQGNNTRIDYLKVTSLANISPDIAAPALPELTYGQRLSEIALETCGGRASFLTLEVPGTFVFEAPDLLLNAGTHDIALIFRPEGEMFASVRLTVPVTVGQATLVSLDLGKITAGEELKLSQLSLPDGFAFVDPDEFVKTGKNVFDAVYRPADPNYSEVKVKISFEFAILDTADDTCQSANAGILLSIFAAVILIWKFKS